jgi:type IV pilus assembly protein PilW
MTSSFIPERRRSEGGFTLIELMVALLLSLLLAVAILKMQTKMASQTVRVADSSTRDTQARAAMDLITRDLTGSGFLLGATQYYCSAVFTYNSGTSTGYFAHHAADAVSAVSGTKLPFAPSVTLNYPSGATSAPTSDVLVTMATVASTQFNDSTNPVLRGTVSAPVLPMTTGVAPLSSTSGLTAGDTAIVQVPIGTSLPCLRVPVTKFTTNATMTSAKGTTMPGGFYGDFATAVSAAGQGTLSNVGIYNSKVVDIGIATSNPATASPQQFAVYYIDGSSNPYPVLMRGQYSMVDDSVVTAPQPIAAGVVALRVAFGVDKTNSMGITAYEDGPTVTANNDWGNVRSVRVALVTRTINDDPNSDNAAASAPTSIQIGSASNPWTGTSALTINVPASKHRYIVNTTEVAYRNWLWKN